MTLVVSGENLSIEEVVQVARHDQKVEIHPQAVRRMEDCREMLEKKIRNNEIMYGVNTGIGEFSEVVLSDEQVQDFQKYLIYNHAAGIGDPAPLEFVRGAMLSRVNVLSNEQSGIRPLIVQTFVEMLNRGVTPYVCQKGSVGACGDLAPMAQIALLPAGRGAGLLSGKTVGWQGGPRARQHPGPGSGGERRPGCHQRFQFHRRHVGPLSPRRLSLAEAGHYCFRHVARVLESEPEALQPPLARGQGIPGGRSVRQHHQFARCRRRPEGGTSGMQGPGRLLHEITPQVIGAALDALAWADLRLKLN